MSNFTDTYIKGLKPKKERHEKYEGGGFGIRIGIAPKGVKTWIYRYKINGITEKLTLGHYPKMSLANAKKRFIELSDVRKEGINPKDYIEKAELKENNTVKKLIQDWYSNYAEKNRKKPFQIKQQIDADIIPLLGEMSLEKIQTRDISKALDKIVERGARIHANRVLSTIKQALNYAVSRGVIQHNPATGIRARDIGGLEKPRERVLFLNEIKKIFLFLDGDNHQLPTQTRNAIKILFLVGVRSAELRLATWNEIDFDNALWTIPAAHSKAGIIHKVHLSPLVLSLFLEIKSESDSEYVLSYKDGNSPLTLNALPRAVNRIQQRIGIEHWTIHDARRSFATHLGETLRIEPVVIEKCLGHKMPRIMATYNKNEMLAERKEALNQWGNYVDTFVYSENIVPLLKVI